MTLRILSFPVALVLLGALASPALAIKDGRAKFMGGTIKTIKDEAEGPIDLTHEKHLTFLPQESPSLEISWDRVSQIEYGQKVARKKATGLLSKSRKHFVTITYQDADKKEQAIVLEFSQDDIRMVLASLKARTLQSIVFQDDEARKQMGGAVEKK